MKKVLLVLVMVGLAGTAFAGVDVSLTGQATTDADSIWPMIGLEIDVGKLDILFGFEFGVSKTREHIGDPNQSSVSDWKFGFYGGIAPEVDVSDKVSVSFPILLRFLHHGEKHRYKDSHYETPIDWKKTGYNVFGIDLGARTYFAVSQRWGIFGGFNATVFSVRGRTKTTNFAGNSSKDDSALTTFLYNGTIDLGVKFTF